MTFINAGADPLCNPVSSLYAMKKVETAVDNKAKNFENLLTIENNTHDLFNYNIGMLIGLVAQPQAAQTYC